MSQGSATVLLVVSGSTEREALPSLLRSVCESVGRRLAVVFPPRHQLLTPEMVAQLIISQYWAIYPRIEKAVVLLDADGGPRDDREQDMRDRLVPRVAGITAKGVPVLVTAAKWHLEAWFFGDPSSLRDFIGRGLGSVDTSDFDGIENPKLHLLHLLAGERLYTATVAGEIARRLDSMLIRAASDSFRSLEEAVASGSSGRAAP